MSSAVAAPAGPARQFKLATESELRVEVSQESPLRVRLVSGTAEIFGTELPPENWISIPPRHKFAIFTWHGATVELEGTTEVEYVADETPMVSYVNVHAILDARRSRAKASQSAELDSSQIRHPWSNLGEVNDCATLEKMGGTSMTCTSVNILWRGTTDVILLT